ncbi:MAG: YveK family protein [Solirubrobacterales bacterium]
MESKRLVQAVVRNGWLILLVGIAGAGLAFYFAYASSTPVYRSESLLFVMNRDKVLQTGQPLDFNDLSLGREMAQDYGVIMQSRTVRADVVRRLGIKGLNEDMLNAVVKVSATKDTPTITVSAIWADPRTAALITDTTSTVIVEKVNELTGSNSIGILDKASVPRAPLPNRMLNQIALGLLGGLAFGLLMVYFAALFDSTVRSAEDIEKAVALPVIGIIPELSIR